MATNQQIYELLVKTQSAVQSLNSLQSKVKETSQGFSDLKNAISGIAVGAVIRSLLQFADSVQDLSDATGIATSNILGFQKAVQAFGGNAETADKAILRLVSNIGGAADGSAELQGAFGKVGVTLNDLATLSEQDILAKTIKGLEGITDKSEQAYLKQQLLGKEFRNVATSGLADAYAKSTEESKKYADSIKSAAETQQRLDEALAKVKTTLLTVIQPMTDFVNSMDKDKLLAAVEAFTRIAAVVVTFAAFGRLVAIVEGLVVGLTGAAGAAALFGINLLKNFTLFGKVLAGIAVLIEGFKILFPDTAKTIGESFGKATAAVKEFFGIKPTENAAPIKETNQAIDDSKEKAERAAEAKRKLKAAIDELKGSLSGVTENFAKMNAQNIAGINLQEQLIGLTKQEVDARQAQAEITRKAADEIAKLEQQKSKLNDAQKQQGGVALIDQTIAKIKEQAEVDKAATEQAIKNLEAKRNAYEALKSIQDFAYKTEVEGVRKVQDAMDNMRLSTMSGVERAYEEIEIASRKSAESAIDAENSRRRSAGLAKMTVDEEKKYYQEAGKGNAALKASAEEQYNYSRKFSTGWKQAMNEYVDNATNAANRAKSIFQKATKGMEDLIVNFAKTGKFEWKNFVAMMLEELLRAQIQQIFAQLMTGMKDSMSTGGGGGGIMGAIGGLFGGGGQQQGGGGILDSIGSIFGMGSGGGAKGSSANNPMYVIDVGGGGGGGMGGLFGGGDPLGDFINTLPGMQEDPADQGGGIWGGIKDTFGGIADSIGGAFGGIADSIGGIFSGGGDSGGGGGLLDSVGSLFGGGDSGGGGFFDSIGSMFDGWFANGGQIGAGKFGVVGENGPEFVSGPANVTPMGGGTNVTYNINAVDAMSFKQMLAQDPSFIYALSMQGGGGIPSRR